MTTRAMAEVGTAEPTKVKGSPKWGDVLLRILAGDEHTLALRDQLERALARLPLEQRAVVVLVYYLDLPLADAAEALGIPLGTTKSRLNRATSALRAALDADSRETTRTREVLA